MLFFSNYLNNTKYCRRITEYFQAEDTRNIVIILGKNGVYSLIENGEELLISNFNDVIVVDSAGAGDAFSGGLLATLSQEYTF